MKYIFVDVDVNTIVRVTAASLDEAWEKYISHRISLTPQSEREPYYTRGYKYIRKDLEHSIFVASEDLEVIEID